MIKRRFYREEHADRNDDPSDSSSSSSSFSETEVQESEDDEDEVSVPQVRQDGAGSCSTSSGYEREDSSANQIDENASDSGLLTNEEETEIGNERHIFPNGRLCAKPNSQLLLKKSNISKVKESLPEEFPVCVLKCKSVLKCRICPRIVCLNEESMRTHLQSKRHSRSEKLLNEGRLKAMLNSDGEMDHEESPAKQHAKVAALAQDNPKKKRGGRLRQSSRRKKFRKNDKKNESDGGKMKQSKENPAKKRHKSEN